MGGTTASKRSGGPKRDKRPELGQRTFSKKNRGVTYGFNIYVFRFPAYKSPPESVRPRFYFPARQ